MEAKIYWDLSQTYQNLYSLNESYQEIVEETHPEDIVVGYLLDEGYASCFEDAEVIMANMSDRWFDLIVEGRAKSTEMDPSEIRAAIKKLEGQINEIVKQVMAETDPATKAALAKKAKALRDRIPALKNELKFHNFVHDKPSTRRGEGPKPRDPGDALTPEERKDLRAVRTKEPTGTEKQREAIRAGIAANADDMRSGRVGTLTGGRPQTNRDDVPNTVSSRNRRGAEAGQGILGNKDPVSGREQVYYDPETGAPQPLISTSQTANRQIRSGATRRERRSGATTQRGEFHSTTGAGLRGSTQERRTGPEGEGRRPNQR